MARSIRDVAVILAARTGGEVAEVCQRLVEHARVSGIAPLATAVTVVDDDQVRELLTTKQETAPAAPTSSTTVAEAITVAGQRRRRRGSPGAPGNRS